MTFSSLVTLGLVGLAGATGALARYLLGRFIAERAGTQIPLGTLLINCTGALVIGLLFTVTERKLIQSSLQLILATGFLGGYTTFSTMSWEAVQLVRGGSTRQSLLYLGSTVAIGLCAVVVGMAIGQVL